ncbi:MAG: hypothetical protein PHY14_03335 [Candidatus Gracilibacteria bacterium]|nr:hypothetical protein [Candidatus Gracilibacteria bacterium]
MNGKTEIATYPDIINTNFSQAESSSIFIIYSIFPFVVFPQESGLFLIFVVLLTFIVQIVIQYSHPLYAFGNIGEKIQKLTPEIESQSKLIQLEFQKDQNFSVLHSGFEKLSETFSRIGELVLKLEGIEKKANKGNLFDSEKYIGSLRTDIVTPLVELKKFLESQREELLQSQKELSKVIVGESSEFSGNRDLATKRGEEILRELDGNISKLGEMIGKIG